MGEGRGHEGEHNAQVSAAVSPEVFDHERSQMRVGDHQRAGSDMNDPSLDRARTVTRETLNEYCERTGDASPGEFNLVKGMTDLLTRINGLDQQQAEHYCNKFQERSSQQSNPRAAAGFQALSQKLYNFYNA